MKTMTFQVPDEDATEWILVDASAFRTLLDFWNSFSTFKPAPENARPRRRRAPRQEVAHG